MKRYSRTKRVYSTRQIQAINRKFGTKGPAYVRGGGGGYTSAAASGGQAVLSGTHSYDSTFGYSVAKLNMNTTFNTNPRNQGNVTINGALDQIMTDADFTLVMSDATHITICFESTVTVLTLPSAQTNRAIVHTKAQIVTDPNVTQFPTTSLSTLGQTVAASAYGMIWHDEDSGATLSGGDYSGLGVLLSSNAAAEQWGTSVLGYNEVSHIGETSQLSGYRTYDQDIMTIWVTNSGVAPVLS